MSDVATLLFVHFNFIIQFQNMFLFLYLIQTNFGCIVCYDIDNVHIEIISIQKLINIDCRKDLFEE
jgi:hypothetical protein